MSTRLITGCCSVHGHALARAVLDLADRDPDRVLALFLGITG